MKFTTVLFSLAFASTALAFSTSNPSNTIIRINTEPRLAISKSRVTSSLARSPALPVEAAHVSETAKIAKSANAAKPEDNAALHYHSNAVRDASMAAVRARTGMWGMSRRNERDAVVGQQRRAENVSSQKDDEKVEKGSGMGKTRRGERKQRGDPKFRSARW